MTPESSNLLPGLIFINPETLTQLTGIEFRFMAESFWSLYVEALFLSDYWRGLFYLRT